MNSNPLVSIGVLSYNNSKYLQETLNSLKNQSYNNIEIVVNDDASTDNSKEIINEWAKTVTNAKVLIANTNQGICKSLNKIITHCTGDYICMIASDDYYEPDFVAKRVDFLSKTNADVGACYSWSKIIYEDGRDLHFEKREETPSGFIFDFISSGVSSLAKPLTLMVKKEVYLNDGLYDENLYYEDLDWFLRISQKYKFLFFDSYDTVYRERAGSLGTKIFTTPKGIESQLKIIRKNKGVSKIGDKNLDKRLRFLTRKSWNISKTLCFKVANERNKLFPSLEAKLLYLTLLPFKNKEQRL